MRNQLLLIISECWLVYCINALSLSPCGNDQTLEVIENKADNLFTCTGLTAADSVYWRLIINNANNQEYELGRCEHGFSCVINYPNVFPLRRPTTERSTLTVNSTNSNNNGYFQNSVIICRTQRQTRAQCNVDFVAVPTTKSCDVRYNTSLSTPWTVTTNCSFTGVYSYLGRYNCRLIQTSPTTIFVGSVVNSTLTGNSKHKSGTCEVTVPFPSTSGSYSYDMVIVPGRVIAPAMFEDGGSSFQITRPSMKPNHTCQEYVPEGGGVTCTCSSSDKGHPAGVVAWSSSGSDQLSLSNVNRNQDKSDYVCEVTWNTRVVQSVTYTLQVAYGPSSTTLTTSTPLPFDTDGSHDIIITCSGNDVNPTPTYTWPQLPGNHVVHGRSVTFTPQIPGEDNSVFKCHVHNPQTSVNKDASIIVALNYPPTADPTISKDPPGHLYQGDRLTLTCGVTGGKPVDATTLTFTCTSSAGVPGQQVVQGLSGVSKSVTFDNVTAGDHGRVCTCATKWKQTDWYHRSEAVTIIVNTPPSPPTIHPPPASYPPIASVTASLTFTCNSATPGQPAATYTWPNNQGGQPSTDSQGRGTLTFAPVTKDLNEKVISCKANNLYTTNRQQVANGKFTLNVYYRPEVRVAPVTDLATANQCTALTSDPTQCMVTEGERVHFKCTANSNPAPATFSWTPGAGSGPDLNIESANRAQNNAAYVCSVTTERGSAGDTPLPLTGTATITVIVAYPPSIPSFTIDSSNTNVTVGAGDDLTLTCTADGRPSPRMRLIHPNGSSIESVEQGKPSLTDEPREISRQVAARCGDTGMYTCDVRNDVGTSQGRHVTVFVQCGPESVSFSGETTTPVVNLRKSAGNFSFGVTAYPVPKLKSVRYITQQPNATSLGQPARQQTVGVNCSSANLTSSDVTCLVTVDKSSVAGFYQAMIGNDFGNLTIPFEVKVNATISPQEGGFSVAAAAGGIVAALVVIGIVVLALVVVRRKRAKSKPDSMSARELSKRQTNAPRHAVNRGEKEDPGMITNDLYVSSGPPEDVMITNDLYVSSGPREDAPNRSAQSSAQGSAYEDVGFGVANPSISRKPKAAEAAADIQPQLSHEETPGDDSYIYASVKKDRKPGTPTKPKPTTGTKPKVAKKKPTQGAKGKKKGKQPNENGGEYSNTTLLSMSPQATEATEYANTNMAFQKDNIDTTPDTGDQGAQGYSCNADGLTYSTISFSDSQREKASKPAPRRNPTDYSTVDFKNTASGVV